MERNKEYVGLKNQTKVTLVDESGNFIYVGEADAGAATSVAVWKIQRITTTNPLKVEFADGNSLQDNIWDDRATLSYS